jgi:hypothetical protein
MQIRFDDLIKVSTNEIYSGGAAVPWKRKKLKEDYLMLTHNALKDIKPIKGKVDLDFVFYFKKHLLDSSNCSYASKLIEDCLVAKGVLKNDSEKYVGRLSMESTRTDGPDYCQLTITKYER